MKYFSAPQACRRQLAKTVLFGSSRAGHAQRAALALTSSYRGSDPSHVLPLYFAQTPAALA